MKIVKHSDQSGVDTVKTPSVRDNLEYIAEKLYRFRRQGVRGRVQQLTLAML